MNCNEAKQAVQDAHANRAKKPTLTEAKKQKCIDAAIKVVDKNIKEAAQNGIEYVVVFCNDALFADFDADMFDAFCAYYTTNEFGIDKTAAEIKIAWKVD
jgi:hypothetical protein